MGILQTAAREIAALATSVITGIGAVDGVEGNNTIITNPVEPQISIQDTSSIASHVKECVTGVLNEEFNDLAFSEISAIHDHTISATFEDDGYNQRVNVTVLPDDAVIRNNQAVFKIETFAEKDTFFRNNFSSAPSASSERTFDRQGNLVSQFDDVLSSETYRDEAKEAERTNSEITQKLGGCIQEMNF